MGAHIGSYYAATARNQLACPRLQADIDVDVAIVGAGFTGVATGLELAERGLRVAICEASMMLFGILTAFLINPVASTSEISRTSIIKVFDCEIILFASSKDNLGTASLAS